MIDPHTCTIQGDISRQDVVELVRLAQGRRVVEFGMGGSTLILARVAATLHSYETDPHWYDLTRHRLQQVPDCCPVQLALGQAVPETLPEHDLLWVDGWYPQRTEWMRRFALTQEYTVLHDSRGSYGDLPTVGESLAAVMLDRTKVLALDAIQFHPGNSNLVVLRRRPEPVEWVNWNLAERTGRADFYGRDFVS